MRKRYYGKKDLPALQKTLVEAECMIESNDADIVKTGKILKRLILKLIEKRISEAEALEKKKGPYTHAEATAPKD